MAISKNDVVRKVSSDFPGITFSIADAVVTKALDVIKMKLVQGEDVSIYGFGTFKITERSARMGRNPLTGATISIPAKKTVRFVPSGGLKTEMNVG